MKKIAKPLECPQLWDEMQAAPGGRLCAKCDEVLIDFSKMK